VEPKAKAPGARWAVFGGKGCLGPALRERAWAKGAFTVLFQALDGRPEKWDVLTEIVRELSPHVIVNASAVEAREQVATDPAETRRCHVVDAERAARLALLVGATLVHVSTDLVFEGASGAAQSEQAPPAPRGILARAMAEGEDKVRETDPGALLVRTGCLFGVRDTGFAWSLLARLAEGKSVHVGWEKMGAPVLAADVARVIEDLVERGRTGTYHVTSGEITCWAEVARFAVSALGASPSLVSTGPRGDVPAWAAPLRPAILSPERLIAEGIEPPRDWRAVTKELVEVDPSAARKGRRTSS